MQKKSSFSASLWLAAVAVAVVLPVAAAPASAAADAGEPPTTVVLATDPPTTTPPATSPPTTAPPATDPPTTAPPATSPATTAPPPTGPPTTTPPATSPPTTAPATTAPAGAGQVNLPPATSPASPGAGGGAVVGQGTASGGSDDRGPAGAFKSSVDVIGSTTASAAERVVAPAVRRLARTPAVRRLAESEPVAATTRAVARATGELRDLEPARIVPYLWLALVALLVTTGVFLRLWWAPPDWPSFRSLAVGAHRRAGQRPALPGWGWPATPRPAPRRNGGWRPPPVATGRAARRPPHRVGIDVGRLRSGPPGKRIFSGQHGRTLRG